MRIWRREQPVLITSAADPRHVDIRRREGQYLFWMGFRVLCFVLAVVLFHGWIRFVATVVALIIPWVAVVVANGGPAPSRRRPAGYQAASRAVQGGARPLESGAHPVVDVDDPRDGGSGYEAGSGRADTDGTRSGSPRSGPAGTPGATRPAAGFPGPQPSADRPPFAPPYTPPPPRADIGFFGPRRPPRSGRPR